MIFTCLPRSRDVNALIFGKNGLAEGLTPGKLVIDQTSGVPSETIAIARRLKDQGVDMIDASVSASPQIIPQGGATLMVGGPDEIIQRAMPHLKSITQTIQICGARVGDGQAMKMVNNAINGTNRVGMFEVIALGRRLGIALETMRDVFGASSAQNIPAVRMLPAMVEGRASTNFGLPLMLKDINQAVSLGSDIGSPMPVTNAARAWHQFGVNFIGPKSNLEDTIKLAEVMADTTFRGAAFETRPSADTPATTPKICIVGGKLGKEVAQVLAERFSATVIAPGAVGTTAGAAALANADVIILALSDATAAQTALSASAAGLRNKTVLWMSGGTWEEIAAARSEAESGHAAFVDAAFCAVPSIKSDTVLAWSGDVAAGADLAELFSAISQKVVFCGAAGKASDLAMLNTAVTAICAVVTVECAMVGERFGLTMERMSAVLGIGSGGSAALRSILSRLATKGSNGDGDEVLAQVAAELKRFNQLALEAGGPVFIAQSARAVIEATLINRGPQSGFDDLASYYSGAR